MVRTYLRKTDRQSWSEESMAQAVKAVLNKEIGYKKASKQYKVPQTTLERYVKKKQQQPDYDVKKSLGRFKCVFSEAQEAELASYLVEMEGQLFGLTRIELRELAYQLAERNNLQHPFGEDEKAGLEWVRGFLVRHPNLSIRKPEPTSAARAMGFNRVSVEKFFNLLTNIVDTHKLTADRIYNCDETGISVNPKNQTKIIAQKGRRQVGVLTSAERGETVTAEICFSAAGSYVPPMLIFPRKRMRQEFETGLPAGATAETHETGWMTKDLFLTWFKKFIDSSKATKENPVLLILDGHATHTKSLELIDLARNNGVILLCLPPHCSHKLQPLDVSYMRPLSKYYEDEVRKWLRSNPGKVVTLFQIAALFGAAYLQASTMMTAVNGFRKCGIWPVDNNVFTDVDFLAAKTTDIQRPTDSEETVSDLANRPNKCSVPHSPGQASNIDLNLAIPSTSKESFIPLTKDASKSQDIQICQPSGSSFNTTSPKMITPVPQVSQQIKRVSRKRGKTVILTSSPYKMELVEAEKGKQKKQVVEKKQKFEKVLKKFKPPQKIVKKVGQKQERKQSSETEQDDDCLYCHDYSEEGWIRCANCMQWAHNSCAGVDSDDDEAVHTCVLCEK